MIDIFDIPTPDTIDPRLWGRGAWDFLDMVVVMYPKEDPPLAHRDAVASLLENFQYFLPCPECKNNYQQFLLDHPIGDAVLCRNNLVEFYYQLRMDVARHTKQTLRLTMRDLWQQIVHRFKLWEPPHTAQNRILPMNPTSSRFLDERRSRLSSRSGGCGCSSR